MNTRYDNPNIGNAILVECNKKYKATNPIDLSSPPIEKINFMIREIKIAKKEILRKKITKPTSFFANGLSQYVRS
jgi:hypothetical protein